MTGIFDAHLAATAYLRLIVGLWGLESLVLVLVGWLLGGLVRLRGLLPATLAAMTGGTVALASADLAVGLAAGAATGLAALVVVLHAEGPAAVAAAARELRVSLVGGAVLLACLAVVPVAGRLALFGAGVAEEPGGPGTPIGTAAIGLVAVATTLAVAARWGMLPFHVRVSRLADLVPAETLPLLLAWIAVPITVVAIAMVDRLLTPLALPLGGERTVLVLFALRHARRGGGRGVLPRRPAARRGLRDRRASRGCWCWRSRRSTRRRGAPAGLGRGARGVEDRAGGVGGGRPRTGSGRGPCPTCGAGSGGRRSWRWRSR